MFTKILPFVYSKFTSSFYFLSMKVLLCLSLLCVPVRFIFPQDGELPNVAELEPEGTKETLIRGLVGGAEILLSNGILMSYNTIYNEITGRYSWATPTANSIRNNLTKSWEWDGEDFGVNQRGHPYQGSVFFSAGRVNGFNFYESVFFGAFGSSTWEVFFENQQASINDLITTVTAAPSTGEMLYRLYLEAYAAGVPAPLAFFINPIAGFHRLVTGWKPPDYGRNIYSFQVYSGTGYAQTGSSLSENGKKLFSFSGPFVEAGFTLIYGNPFEQKSKTPFNHFELSMNFGLDLGNYMVIRAISDGYLFSFSPVNTNADTMSTGLSLHWDISSHGKFSGGDSTIDQYSSAFNWTIKYRHLFSENTVFQAKVHTGVTVMGTFNYYSPDKDICENGYGAGLNSKLFVNLKHKDLGELEMSAFTYMLWCYPEVLGFSRGTVYWLFADLAYSYPVSERLSLGATNSLAMEWGLFSGFPNTRKYNNAAKLFIAWNL